MILSPGFQSCEYVAIYREETDDLLFIRRPAPGEKPTEYEQVPLQELKRLAQEQIAQNKAIKFISEQPHIKFQEHGPSGRSGCPEGSGWKSLNDILQQINESIR